MAARSRIAASLASPLDTLPVAVRRAVVLRVVDRLEFAEIAARLECTELVARRRVQVGLRALRSAA
jgi:DNA-directed RNA polymerase specialized sigma24 family protein